ncbi:hypothetical protein E2C00_33120 [Streptomyces sp. WAC05374]|uniref:DUF6434 domain-containing protein n=1 Tax=Streptomyces sp. WAC05374 TaxID=2487420 RepID=UPI000F8899CC|nr:DUF6434 domain-containing protein [Streptomyces sp. WAC05374]RST16897.1 hypothetical protein EF905_11135 [Streptomyces sp. WAC05374]TDF36847.1 hypothetical protein E2B92_30770 [Streptomyces sp. WAC05374]TDF46277.1 hypothetical protein E2C02_32180 [Streptomyces sp. WAC05374]TDF46900.1 hypothetical protein E2C00_33120 [Streptomyces sp. WAC05374]
MSSNTGAEARPELSAALSGDELARWYWTLAELTGLARELGIPRSGGKAALTRRLRAALDGVAPPPAPLRRRSAGRQLAAPVNGSTVIPEGQRCSQVLREFFRREIGPSFHFDAYMRTFITEGAGSTLAHAIAHWHATRQAATQPREIGSQFELNRFLRDWHAEHPAGSRTEALTAWRAHRDQPRDPTAR